MITDCHSQTSTFTTFFFPYRLHLGFFCNWECAPTFRGLDSLLGYFVGSVDYDVHSSSRFEMKRMVPAGDLSDDPASDPKPFGGVSSPGLC